MEQQNKTQEMDQQNNQQQPQQNKNFQQVNNFTSDMSSINSPMNNFSNFLVSPHETQILGLNGKTKFGFNQKSKQSAMKYLDQIEFLCTAEKQKNKENYSSNQFQHQQFMQHQQNHQLNMKRSDENISLIQQKIIENNHINFQEIIKKNDQCKDSEEITQLSLLNQENQQLKLQLFQQFNLNQEFQVIFSKMKEDLDYLQKQTNQQKEKKQKYKQMSLQYENVATQQNETINELQQKLMQKKLKYKSNQQNTQKQIMEFQLIIQQQNQQLSLSQNFSTTNFQDSTKYSFNLQTNSTKNKEILKSIDNQAFKNHFISEHGKNVQDFSEKLVKFTKSRDDYKRKSMNQMTPNINNVFNAINIKNKTKQVSQFTTNNPNNNSKKKIEILKQQFKEQQNQNQNINNPVQRLLTIQPKNIKENLKKNFKDFLQNQKNKAPAAINPIGRQSMVQFQNGSDINNVRNSSLEFKKYFQQKYQQEKRNTVYN